jgi:hypothetical protein
MIFVFKIKKSCGYHIIRLPFVIGIVEKWNTGIMVKQVRASTEFDFVP